MSTIQPVQQTNVNFKGELKQTANGNSYYATDMGGKLLGGIAAAETVVYLIGNSNKGATLVGGALGTGISYALGHYVDNKRNKHAAQAADYIKQVGAKNAVATNDRIRVADNGHAYYHSNDGRKFLTKIGAFTGAISGLFGAVFAGAIAKYLNLPKVSKAAAIVAAPILGTCLGALGGWVDGAIVDWINNRSAKKHA